MSSSRALNDDEVYAEMKKMIAFIKQEALEKAREIKVKSDEEFNIEKAKLVRQESINIDATYERKIKQVEIEKTITKSTLTNKSRLEILAERQNLLNSLFDKAAEELVKVSSDNEKYYKFIKDLLLQGFYQLMEPKVTVACREKDSNLVLDAAKEANETFQAKFNYSVEIELDKINLPEDSAGGIVLSCNDGRIKVSNTLESRLNLLKDQMLPQIRYALFGVSPSRRFFN